MSAKTFALPLALGLAALPALAPAQEADRLKALEERLEAMAEILESGAAPAAGGGVHEGSLGAYGEMHYSRLRGDGAREDELDFHRFVIFLGHRFNERIAFDSELEVEHSVAADGADGGVELEQAFLSFQLPGDKTARVGLLLVPVGILNETHEPATFYGVERNPIESKIIPTTWGEGGVALAGRLSAGLGYDVVLSSGLKTAAASAYAVRKGRQKVSEAQASDPALTLRLRWTGRPGLELAGSYQYQSDITQGQDPAAGAAQLFEGHVVWQRGPWGLRALYATWRLEGSGPRAVGAHEQTGWYVEPSYRLSEALGVYLRHNRWDNAAGGAGDSAYAQTNLGLNYWPHPDVVLKVDLEAQDAPAGQADLRGIRLGMGYQF